MEKLKRTTLRLRPQAHEKLVKVAGWRRASMAAVVDVLFFNMPEDQIEKYLG